MKPYHIYCKVCQTHHLIAPEQGSTWHNTEKGIVAQSWCPKCGEMLPLINDIKFEKPISNRKRKKMITEFAYRHKISIRTIKNYLITMPMSATEEEIWGALCIRFESHIVSLIPPQ
jgi:hypothetical protein